MAHAGKDTAKPAPEAREREPAPEAREREPAPEAREREPAPEAREREPAPEAREREPAPLADGLWIRMGGRDGAEGKAGELWEVRDGAAEAIVPDSDDFRDLMDMRPRLRDAVIEARQRNLG